VKNIGKPCAGKPHARFDEGGLAEAAMARLVRHRQTKGAVKDRPNLTPSKPALYSTSGRPSGLIAVVSYWILRQGTAAKSEQEIEIISGDKS